MGAKSEQVLILVRVLRPYPCINHFYMHAHATNWVSMVLAHGYTDTVTVFMCTASGRDTGPFYSLLKRLR